MGNLPSLPTHTIITMVRAVAATIRVDTLRGGTTAEAMAGALMGTICPQMVIIDTITTIIIAAITAAEAGQGMVTSSEEDKTLFG